MLESDTIRVVKPKQHNGVQLFRRAALINGIYYVKQRGLGILKLKGNSWELLPGSEIFAEVPVYNILPFDKNELLIITNSKGFYRWNGLKFKPWRTGMDALFKKSWIHKAIPLQDKYFAMGTWDAGLVLLDREGRVIQHLTQEDGLVSDLVYSLGMDHQGNLWVGDLHGISYIEIASPFSRFEEQEGITGNAYTSEMFGDHLYVGTSEGVFKNNWPDYQDPFSSDWHFQRLIEIDMVVFKLLKIENTLLIGSLSGIWEVNKDDQNIQKISPNIRVLNLLALHNDPNHLLAATITGLALLKKNTESNSTWTYHGPIKGFDKQVFQLVQDNQGSIWAGDRSQGIFRIELNPEMTAVTRLESYDTKNGLPFDLNNSVFQTSKEMLVTTQTGIYQFNAKANRFEPHPIFEKQQGANRATPVVIEDAENAFWYWQQQDISNPQLGYELIRLAPSIPSDTSAAYHLQKDPFKSINWSFYSFVPFMNGLPDSTMIFGSPKGFIHYDDRIPHFYDASFQCLLRKVEIISKQDSVIFGGTFTTEKGGISPEKIIELPYKYNALRFAYAANMYNDIASIVYQYQLKGFDNNWSSWSGNYFKEYTNIPEGTYQFMARAKNINGTISEIATFHIQIHPPIYRSIAAYFLYFFLTVFGVREYVRFKNRKLIADKANLEKLVKKRTNKIEKQKEVIMAEKDKADNLLLNILPRETVNELKETGVAMPKSYQKVTVCFTDFKGFTKISENLSPEKLVEELNICFLAFDAIIEKYGLEKIKTIGDGYMAAGGIPIANETNPKDTVNAALEMIAFMEKWKKAKHFRGEPSWEIRIGIHTGELIAGVIGKNKFAYDIWGDTVNTASHMETSGASGKINISNSTYELVKDDFECAYRGKVVAKNKGKMDMYFVVRKKERAEPVNKAKIKQHPPSFD